MNRTTTSPPPPSPQPSATVNNPAAQTHTNKVHKPRSSPFVKHLNTKRDNLEHSRPQPNALVKHVNQYSPSVTHTAQQPHGLHHSTISCPDNQKHKESPHKRAHTYTTLEPIPHKNKRKLGFPRPPQHKANNPQSTHTSTPTAAQSHRKQSARNCRSYLFRFPSTRKERYLRRLLGS